MGRDNNVIVLVSACTFTPTSCYATVFSHGLPHLRHATRRYLFHAIPQIRHGVVWGGVLTSLHLRFHALPHIRHARLVETSDGVMVAGR